MAKKKTEPEKSTVTLSEEWITKSSKKRFPLFIVIPVVILILIAAFGGGFYYYFQYQNAKALLGDQALPSANTSQLLINKVGQLMDLPTNETPQIATVTDITKLTNQPFFRNAKNGDKVLIYTKNQEAIIFDPVANKIVTVGPISIKPPVQSVAGAAITPTLGPVRVAIYNGTQVIGLAKTVQKELAADMSNVNVVETTNADKSTYQQTIIVSLNGTNANNAAQLASVLHGTVGTLPAGEIKPTNADILIILGKQE